MKLKKKIVHSYGVFVGILIVTIICSYMYAPHTQVSSSMHIFKEDMDDGRLLQQHQGVGAL